MSWYAAHLVLYVKLKEHRQDRFPVWENIVLIRAGSEEEAIAKAEQRGREEEGDDEGTFRWGGKPAQWVFAGVRKLTACQGADKRPADGTEISYIEMEAASREVIEKLLDGEPASVRVVDRFGAAVPGDEE
jgi:hypothetical protein